MILLMWYIFIMIHAIRFTHDNYTIHVGNRGRVVLPAEVRHRLDLKEGDRLILAVEQDGSVRLVSARMLAHKLQGLFADLAPGAHLVDELLIERQTERSGGK